MVITTPAIVLSALKYGEADLIVCCFTKEAGIKTYLLRRILKSKKGKLRTSYFQPLTLLDLIAVHKDKGTLERINEAKVREPYRSLHTNVAKSGMVMFLAEILKTCIQEEEANPELYDFVANALIWLDTHEEIANFHILFLLQLTYYLGFFPDPSEIEAKYFNLLEGCFQEIHTHAYCETGPAVVYLKEFFGINFDELQNINQGKTTRLAALNLLLLYYKLHLQGFKNPKSLLVLNQLFN
jgi:DNA repair protein RecO (recombination protein O)